MKYLFTIFFICFLASASFAQFPIRWSTSINKISNTEYDLVLTAKIDSSWKIIGLEKNIDGPIPFSFKINNTTNITKLDSIKSLEKPKTTYDSTFKGYYAYHKNEANFVQRIYIEDVNQDATLEAAFEFMVYNNVQAIAPIYQCVKFKIDANTTNLSKKRIIHVGKDRRIGDCN